MNNGFDDLPFFAGATRKRRVVAFATVRAAELIIGAAEIPLRDQTLSTDLG